MGSTAAISTVQINTESSCSKTIASEGMDTSTAENEHNNCLEKVEKYQHD